MKKINLKKIHTGSLLRMLRTEYIARCESPDEVPTEDELKEELRTREHILKKDQKQLIKKMSMKIGKRLSLKDAQIVANKIKNKNN